MILSLEYEILLNKFLNIYQMEMVLYITQQNP